ncbi:hypothetical protein SAMN04487765_0472 [Tenacibaculum sp. MAR_2010_89]|uniref:hypothetical protein n=1 Tax=Tenacibaculum sp. MAR_2010_89 TaxID=1250198 RepID=UPI0008969C68|nr:hypothetical protein [Tenacibaculum sp. MAR_2010_89]SED60199.1 hypothetical protein SAMN04487765_0472 [Tenacibaculum sp. MAR_2010_89]
MKRTLIANKLILFITIFSNLISYSQEKIRFINLKKLNSTIYEKSTKDTELPDFTYPITDENYLESIKDTLAIYNEKLIVFKRIEDLEELVGNFQQLKLNTNSKKERKKLLERSFKIYEQNKQKRLDFSPLKIEKSEFKPSLFGYSYNSDDIILKTKKVIKFLNERVIIKHNKEIQEKIRNAKNNLSQGLIKSLPKINRKLQTLKENTDLETIKGEYTHKGVIYVSYKNDYFNKRYKGEIVNSYIQGSTYTYEYYKNINGDGKDVYIRDFRYPKEFTIEANVYKTISEGAKQMGGTFNITALDWTIKLKNGKKINVTKDIYNALEAKNYKYILNKSKIPSKVKYYLKQATPYLKTMYNGILAHKNWTLTKAKKTSWINATKKVKLIDKKIRALYDNNEDNYYDFQKLLDTKTIEDKTYFDTVLNNSKKILGII